MDYPSLYATVRLAIVVQSLSGSLSHIICRSTFGRSLIELAIHAPRCEQVYKSTVRRRSKSKPFSLLDELDLHTICGHFFSRVIAAQDRYSPQYDLYLVRITETVNELGSHLGSFDSTHVLLVRLQDQPIIHDVPKGSSLAEGCLSGESTGEIFAAKFLHVLRSLRPNAPDAFIRHYHKHTAEEKIPHWRYRWRYSKRTGEGWFTEWPNSLRPLSTTWPWNIKPSLLVLWGVCWMFYGPSGSEDNKKRATRNPRGAAAPSVEDLTTLSTGLLGSQPQPTSQNISGTWAGPTSNTYPNNSWLHPTRASVARRAKSDPEPIRENTLSTSYAAGLPAYSYISTPSSSSSDLYPTPTTVWPYCQSINPVPSPAYAPSYTPWQTQTSFDPAGGVLATPQATNQSNIVSPYAQRSQPANRGSSQLAAGSLGSLGFAGLGLHMNDMQDYPSPGSSISEQTSSSYVSVLPSNVISPGISLMPSPNVAEDTASHPSSRRSREPPRNAEGLLYCNHAEHAQEQPPVFSRKCEWRKHMDKHERPYVCEEPECDNVRGFTYSGGLLRHQREVHRQHGGPKASCMCPYPDCKRHVGRGFSRKENLAEHLRRVHRDAGADPMQSGGGVESAPNPSETSGTGGRKRRRAAPEEEEEEVDDEEDLEQEVKKLKRQLKEKDERLEKLERQVQLLVSGQQK